MISLEPSWKKYTLADTFDFTPEDLEANRQGVMSERQKLRDRDTNLLQKGCGLILVAVLLIGLSLFAIYVFTSISNSVWTPITTLMLIIGGVFLYSIGPALRTRRKFLEPQPIQPVNFAIGTIDVDNAVPIDVRISSRPNIMYLLTIGEYKFPVAPRKLYLFDKTKRYRVYFTRTRAYPNTSRLDYPAIRILSIEEVPDERI